MKLSARNVIKGTVVDLKTGPVGAMVHVDVGGGTIITSTITAESASDLGLAAGKQVSVIIKSSSVMLAVD